MSRTSEQLQNRDGNWKKILQAWKKLRKTAKVHSVENLADITICTAIPNFKSLLTSFLRKGSDTWGKWQEKPKTSIVKDVKRNYSRKASSRKKISEHTQSVHIFQWKENVEDHTKKFFETPKENLESIIISTLLKPWGGGRGEGKWIWRRQTKDMMFGSRL